MSDKFSDYSLHYRDMSEDDARRVVESMHRRKIEEFRLKLDVEKILPLVKGPDVLDMPFGVGRFLPHLFGKFNVFGYEISPNYVTFAKERYPDIADHFAVCSFEEISTARQFDTVISLRVLGSVKDMDRTAANIASILKPGGRWIFNYPEEKPRYKDLEALLTAAGLTLKVKLRYDFHASMASMSKLEQKIYDRFRAAIERGWVPYWLYRLIELFYIGRGTFLFVAEKSGR
jgi:2-polyprenyl-3-methyl-5-hydroxy-6-metoxy-1,4-benzoquinol methylase